MSLPRVFSASMSIIDDLRRVSALSDSYVEHLICTLRPSFLSQLEESASSAPSINLAGIFMSVTYVYRSTTNNVTESLLPNS